jgi:ZIP family zinc transporter
VIPDVMQAPDAHAPTRRWSSPTWLLAGVPLVLLAAVLAWMLRGDAGERLRGPGYPPVEKLAFESVTIDQAGLHVVVVNDGPDPLTIAQVAVDDAFWSFRVEGDSTLTHLGRTGLAIPYPWVHGEPHVLRVITGTGQTFDHAIAVAVPTPTVSTESLATFGLMGVYVGVLPVAIGLLWFPLMRRLGPRGLDFVLSLTVGLLLFLFVDATHEALESAAALPDSFQGVALVVMTAGGAFLALEAFSAWMGRRRAPSAPGVGSGRGSLVALLVACGIGVHNFGEGLAIGGAFALGQAALGNLLMVGFALHNTTEGIAIVAPLAKDAAEGQRPSLGQLVRLGVIGGGPTVLGAWLGGFVQAPLWSVIALAVGVGAIAQVVVQVMAQTAGDRPVRQFAASGPACAGLAAGFAVMYVTGLLVG